MTAYELRRHLRQAHAVDLRGADYATLLAAHDDEHRTHLCDHTHEP